MPPAQQTEKNKGVVSKTFDIPPKENILWKGCVEYLFITSEWNFSQIESEFKTKSLKIYTASV